MGEPEKTVPSPPPAPRWVKLSVAVGLALVLLVVAVHLSGFHPGSLHGVH